MRATLYCEVACLFADPGYGMPGRVAPIAAGGPERDIRPHEGGFRLPSERVD